ncbi:MAG: YciI family protein [Anaerolineae bacterium]
MSELPTFVYLLKPNRATLIRDASRGEEATLGEHFEYLQTALSEGRLILAGPCEDREFGIVIFRAGTEEEALEFVEDDPAVRGGLMTAELHPLRISLVERA